MSASKKKAPVVVDAFNLEDLPLTPLNEDGSIDCRACKARIHFLPATFPEDQLPDGAPRSVNHSGCPFAKVGESPAGPDAHTGLHETINRIDAKEVQAYYQRKR